MTRTFWRIFSWCLLIVLVLAVTAWAVLERPVRPARRFLKGQRNRGRRRGRRVKRMKGAAA